MRLLSQLTSVLVGISILAVIAGDAGASEQDLGLADLLSEPGARVVFLGDSITFAGQYVAFAEAELRLRGKIAVDLKEPVFVNLGLSSEGVTGLTEPDHPFPRPNVHERLARVLGDDEWDVVVACYGMNDGIYHPFDDSRFAAYQQGLLQLIDDVGRTDAKLVLLTPPPFDPVPIAKKLVGRDAPEFGYKYVYRNYDAEVISRYADYVRGLKGDVDYVVDFYTLIADYLQVQRQEDASFALSRDGVHPSQAGHAVMAAALLGLGAPPGYEGDEKRLFDLVNQRMAVRRNAGLTRTGHKRPGVKPGLKGDALREQLRELDAKIDDLTRNLSRR